MQWVTEGKLTWRCNYHNRYSAVVKAGLKTPTWTVYLDGKKLKAGKRSHPVDAAQDAKNFMDSKIGGNDELHQENKNN